MEKITSDCYKGSENPHIVTDINRRLVHELYAVGVNQDRIAERLDISVSTLRKHYKNELDSGLENLNIEAINKLLIKVRKGNLKAIMFWLNKRASWYKFSTAHDINNANNKTVDNLVQALLIDKDKNKDADKT